MHWHFLKYINATYLAMIVAVLVSLFPREVRGQESANVNGAASRTGMRWILHLDGREQDWYPGEKSLAAIDEVTTEVLAGLRHEGYPFAVMDSVQVDTTSQQVDVRLFATAGKTIDVGKLVITGNQALEVGDLYSLMETQPGRRFSPRRLEEDLESLLRRYERRGYFLAEIRVVGVQADAGLSGRADVHLHIREGPPIRIKKVVLEGAERTRTGYAARVSGIRTGMPFAPFEPEQIRQRLLETGHFKRVGTPEVRVEEDSSAVLTISVDEESPGLFDIVLGYQPGNGSRSGRIVGMGHLELSNLLGAGLGASIKLNRLPGQVSKVEAGLGFPLLPYLPIGMTAWFEGLQDSTFYSQQRYRGTVSYRLSWGMEGRMSLSRERTRPGQAGVEIQGGRQRVPRAHALFLGLGLAIRRVDRVQNPRRGILFEIYVEQGRKERLQRFRSAQGDTVSERSSERQSRISAHGRLFVPTFPRQGLVLGADVSFLQSETYDPSDLFRFGGATTLRGYDEERFLGRLVSRSLVEYRYQVDLESFVFLFTDLGYIEAPTAGGSEVVRGLYPGFGAGMQFDTPLGMVNTSYAANREGGKFSGRVHVGLAFGL